MQQDSANPDVCRSSASLGSLSLMDSPSVPVLPSAVRISPIMSRPFLAAALLVMFSVAGCDLIRELVPPRIDGDWEADETEWTLADRSVSRLSIRMSLAGTSPVGDAVYVQVAGSGEAVQSTQAEPFDILGTQQNTEVSLILAGVEPLGFFLRCRFEGADEMTCANRSDTRVNRVRFRRL